VNGGRAACWACRFPHIAIARHDAIASCARSWWNRRLHVLLQRDGEQVNHKRVWRVYRAAGLCVKRRRRKRLVRVGTPIVAATRANERWSLDFACDGLASGRAIRVLSVVDTYTRECLALDVDTSFPSPRVTRVLDSIAAKRGLPERIRCDNGPELTSRHFLA
jgi:putative transposase